MINVCHTPHVTGLIRRARSEWESAWAIQSRASLLMTNDRLNGHWAARRRIGKKGSARAPKMALFCLSQAFGWDDLLFWVSSLK